MLRQAAKALRGLTSPDPIRRIQTLELLLEYLLWRNPRDVVDRHLEVPEPLPESRIAGDARLYADREVMLKVVGEGLEIAEVGVDHGDFSRVILNALKPSRLHLIDITFERLNPHDLTAPNVIRHQGDSSTVLAGFPPESLDFVYIDGDHSYEGARKDLVAADRALKPGGKMTCNDYTNWMTLAVTPYGVSRAANEFVIERGYKVEGLALSRWGNHDLLISKPA
jgi:hypothetical protein